MIFGRFGELFTNDSCLILPFFPKTELETFKVTSSADLKCDKNLEFIYLLRMQKIIPLLHYQKTFALYCITYKAFTLQYYTTLFDDK